MWAGKSLARWNAPARIEDFLFLFSFLSLRTKNTFYGSWVRNGGYSSNSKKANAESWVDHDVLPMGVCGGGLLIKLALAQSSILLVVGRLWLIPADGS
jgi:hypothetical protein